MKFAAIDHESRAAVVVAVSDDKVAVLPEKFADVEDVLRASDSERAEADAGPFHGAPLRPRH